MSWFSVFRDLLHISESAAKILGPILATQDAKTGALMISAANAAIAVEAAITAPEKGLQKAAIVAAQSQVVIDLTNDILVSQNKKPLPPNTNDVVQTSVKTVVTGFNAIEAAIKGSVPVVASSLPASLVGK